MAILKNLNQKANQNTRVRNSRALCNNQLEDGEFSSKRRDVMLNSG